MNDHPIEVKMTREMMSDAVEKYLNGLLVGDYDLEEMELHSGGGGRGNAATVRLVPRERPRPTEDSIARQFVPAGEEDRSKNEGARHG